jgi:hypothetical protein
MPHRLQKLQKWFTSRPYLFTSIVFLAIVLLGWLWFNWRKEEFAFVLLLYFIVTLGIRLDDISGKLAQLKNAATQPSADNVILADRLLKISNTLKNIEKLLILVGKRLEAKKTVHRRPVRKREDPPGREN